MKREEKSLLKDFIRQKINFYELREKYPQEINEKYILNELDDILINHDRESLDYLIILSCNLGVTKKIALHLCEFLIVDWHRQHEDLARLFQDKIHLPESIDFLVKAMMLKFDYLFEQDDYEPFVTKCMYAIASLQTEASKLKLKELAISNNAIVKEAAKYQLERLSGIEA